MELKSIVFAHSEAWRHLLKPEERSEMLENYRLVIGGVDNTLTA